MTKVIGIDEAFNLSKKDNFECVGGDEEYTLTISDRKMDNISIWKAHKNSVEDELWVFQKQQDQSELFLFVRQKGTKEWIEA